jgi:mycothione reductase
MLQHAAAFEMNHLYKFLFKDESKPLKFKYMPHAVFTDPEIASVGTKFIVDKNSYEILGCHMIGPQSSTMIHQVLTVMHIDNDIRHLKEMLYIHPALSESLLPAAINTIKNIRES